MKSIVNYILIFFILISPVSCRNSLLYYPSKRMSQTPKGLGIVYEDVYFSAPDGKRLNGWFVPSKGAKVTVLFCHGNAGNISRRLNRVDFFHELGVNFFIFDYRGYGNSEGSPDEKGVYSDAIAAYDYLVSRDDVDKENIVVYGRSLGGAIATELCTKRAAKVLILESSLASVEKRASEICSLPMSVLKLQEFDALSKVKGITIPKLITHGRQDLIIGINHGEALFNNANEPKKFLPFDGNHNRERYVVSYAFMNELKIFFKEYGVQ